MRNQSILLSLVYTCWQATIAIYLHANSIELLTLVPSQKYINLQKKYWNENLIFYFIKFNHLKLKIFSVNLLIKQLSYSRWYIRYIIHIFVNMLFKYSYYYYYCYYYIIRDLWNAEVQSRINKAFNFFYFPFYFSE